MFAGMLGIKVADKRPGFRLMKIVGVLRAGPLLSTKIPGTSLNIHRLIDAAENKTVREVLS